MIKIQDFDISHLERAQAIALENYKEERSHVPNVPPLARTLDLLPLAQNGLGVAAFAKGKLVGFLCSVLPFSNAFRSTDAVGVFSPMGANGALGEYRAKIYAQMYQVAGEKWMKAGASSHAICLYSHAKEVQKQFFRYGFGMRTVDAIRIMEEIPIPIAEGYDYNELSQDEGMSVYPLSLLLNRHYTESPFFMKRKADTPISHMELLQNGQARIFVAKHGETVCAYVKIERDGETFIGNNPKYLHISGAFCLPEHRGKGVYANLINYAIRTLKAEGYTYLGVDFESLNPSAWGFWLKYFHAYTYGLVRRIDEHVME